VRKRRAWRTGRGGPITYGPPADERASCERVTRVLDGTEDQQSWLPAHHIDEQLARRSDRSAPHQLLRGVERGACSSSSGSPPSICPPAMTGTRSRPRAGDTVTRGTAPVGARQLRKRAWTLTGSKAFDPDVDLAAAWPVRRPSLVVGDAVGTQLRRRVGPNLLGEATTEPSGCSRREIAPKTSPRSLIPSLSPAARRRPARIQTCRDRDPVSPRHHCGSVRLRPYIS